MSDERKVGGKIIGRQILFYAGEAGEAPKAPITT